MNKDQFFEREQDIVHLTDGVTSDYLYKKELEEMEYAEYMRGLHTELDRVQQDIELIERALTDALCRKEEILKKLA